MKIYFFSILCLFILNSQYLYASHIALPVLPGLSGFGAETIAGRGGEIIHVTSIEGQGEGTLADALKQKGPKTIVFDVSGTIWRQDYLQLKDPFITIAFQTAPSPGITIAGAGIEVLTHDVLLQHPRVRIGDLINDAYPGDRDGISIKKGSYNVVVDHCSVSWAVDENIGISGQEKTDEQDNIHDISFNNCIISEGLSNSIHPKGEHSKGMLINDYSENISLIKNIFAHSRARSPSFKGATSGYMANNLIYNSSKWATGINEGYDTGAVLVTLIGNYYLLGPSSLFNLPAISIFENVSPESKIYLWDNYASNNNDADYRSWLKNHSPLTPEQGQWSMVQIETSFIPKVETPPVNVADYSPFSNQYVPDTLLASAGSRAIDRDSVDSRIINEIKNRSGSIIDSPTDVGGWPELEVNYKTAEIPDNPNADNDGNGYTNLEEWLHYKAIALEGRGAYYQFSSQQLNIASVLVGDLGFYNIKFKLVDAENLIFELIELNQVTNQYTSDGSFSFSSQRLTVPQVYSKYGTFELELSYQEGFNPLRFKLTKLL